MVWIFLIGFEDKKLNLEKYKVLIFDCDGVIFDTTNLKLMAFQKVLKEYDEKHIKQFTNYFRSNFGRSRFSHARYFIENILNEPFQQKKYDKIIDRDRKILRSEAVRSGVITIG